LSASSGTASLGLVCLHLRKLCAVAAAVAFRWSTRPLLLSSSLSPQPTLTRCVRHIQHRLSISADMQRYQGRYAAVCAAQSALSISALSSYAVVSAAHTALVQSHLQQICRGVCLQQIVLLLAGQNSQGRGGSKGRRDALGSRLPLQPPPSVTSSASARMGPSQPPPPPLVSPILLTSMPPLLPLLSPPPLGRPSTPRGVMWSTC